MKKNIAIFILLLLFCACFSQRKEYIRVEQVDSNYPIMIGGDTTKNVIFKIGFPLVYKIKKNVFENIDFHRSVYMYNGEFRKGQKEEQSIIPYASYFKVLSKKEEAVKYFPKEYIYWTSHIPDTTLVVRELLQPYLDRIRKEKKNPIQIESIQELKKTNPAFLKGFLSDDSIAIGYLTNEKRTIRYTVLPVEIR